MYKLPIIISSISRRFVTGVSVNQASITKMPLMRQLVLVIIYAPVVEEVLFRYVIRCLIRNAGLYILVSGLVFGMVHVLSSIGSRSSLEVILYALPHIGVGLHQGYIYASTNSIETCIITHRMINRFAGIPYIIAWILL